MRKKFTMLLASLFLCMGAWAQTVVTVIDTDKCYTLECQATSGHTARFIGVTDAGIIDGKSATAAYITFEAGEEGSYYIKVGEKYLNHDGTTISASTDKSTAWILGTLGDLVTFQLPNTTRYLNNNGSDTSDGTVTNLKANNHPSGPAASNACSTWQLCEYDLATLVDVTYRYLLDGVVKKEVTLEQNIGTAYATPVELPYVTTKCPEGVVEESTVVDLTCEMLEMPFVAAANFSEIEHWYYMNIRDDGPTYLQYDAEKEYIPAALSGEPTSAKKTYTWGFVGDPFNGFEIVNYTAGETMVLSAPSAPTGNQNASELARMVTKDEATGNTTWVITPSTHSGKAENSFYVQHPTATAYAFNRQAYNGAQTLCYWSNRDTGSALQVVECEVTDLSTDLADLILQAESAMNSTTNYVGTAVGYYTSESVNALNEAIQVAKEVTDATEEDLTALQTAIDGLAINLPETGKFYTVQSNHSGYAVEKYMYARNTDNSVRWGDIDVTNATEQAAVWTFGANGEDFTMQSVATGSYINSVAQSKTVILDKNTSSTVSIEALGNGVVNIKAAYDLHARSWSDWYDVVGWNSDEVNGASAWRIAEVEIFSHTLTIDEYLYMTLQLGYNVTIPKGIEAYAVTGVDAETNELQMKQITGVIPANTAVIVKSTEEIATGETKDYVFTYTAETGTEPEVNYMVGSLYDTYLQPTGTPYVMTLNSNNEIVMGKAKLNLNETGAAGETHFKNRANKAYLDLPIANGAAMYSLGRGEGTTSIEDIQLTNDDVVIYDLTGRRVEKMEKGIYIINGKKIIK